MNKLVALLATALVFAPVSAFADEGIVVKYVSGCSYYVVKTQIGFVILNWYGGKNPEEGDKIVGDLERYGLKSAQNVTKDENMRIFVEKHGISEDEAMERIEKECQ